MRRLRMCEAYRCLHIRKRNVWRLDDSNPVYRGLHLLSGAARAPSRRVGPLRPRLILFGHGARDPRWTEPFERLAARVRAQSSAEVRLAFLELVAPDLPSAAEALIA